MSRIQLFSGRLFNYADPDSTPLEIEEISHALSHICRFNGHLKFKQSVYTVAQHSVLCAVHAPKHLKLQALMHDAAEAVMSDVPTPLKRLLPDYRALESIIEGSIFRTFGLPEKLDPEVKLIDGRMLATEKRDLMLPCEDETAWNFLPEPYDDRIFCWEPDYADRIFLSMFYKLVNAD